MKKYIFIFILFSFAMKAVAGTPENQRREFSITKEKSVKIFIEVAFGSVYIVKAEHGKIATVDYSSKSELLVSYEVAKDTGILNIKVKKSNEFWGDDVDRKDRDRSLNIGISDAIPVCLDFELGAGSGDIDLTGLQIKDLKISAGAGNVKLKCEKPNKITAEEVNIESGVSKFTASDLGNLNFRNLKFCGGVGAYKLDFSGTLKENAEAEVELGLGSIYIYIPKSTPAKIIYDDSWLSSFDIDDEFEETKEGVFETEKLNEAANYLTIRLNSGLGSVRVKRK